MSEQSKLKPGAEVMVSPDFPGQPEVMGRKFIVRKVNPKNVRCDAADGGRGLNYPADSLVAWDEGAAKAADPFAARPFQPVEFYSVGEIVTFKRPPNGHTDTTPFVVFKDDGRKVNVALLGGDNDRYFRTAHAGLVRRDTAWLAENLLEAVTA